MIAGAGADKKVHLLHAPTGTTASFASEHGQAIRAVRFLHDAPTGAPSPIVATGSWDRTIRYWDVRNTAKPLGTLTCPERIYGMDTAGALLVVACADREVRVVDVKADPTKFTDIAVKASSLDIFKPTSQIRAVAALPGGKGWVAGEAGGRVMTRHVTDAK